MTAGAHAQSASNGQRDAVDDAAAKIRPLDPLMETTVDSLTRAVVIQADYLTGLSPVMQPTGEYVKVRQQQLQDQIIEQDDLTHRLKAAQLRDAWWLIKTQTILRWSSLAMVGLTDVGAIALLIDHLGDADALTKVVIATGAGGALNAGAAVLAGRARMKTSELRATPRHARSAGGAAVRSRSARKAVPRSTR